MQAIFTTFFEIGCAVGLGSFLFGVLPSLLVYKYFVKNH